MLGCTAFCPINCRAPQTIALENYNCGEALSELEMQCGADLLMRSAVWLTIKESRVSFAIEHEEKWSMTRRYLSEDTPISQHTQRTWVGSSR